ECCQDSFLSLEKLSSRTCPAGVAINVDSLTGEPGPGGSRGPGPEGFGALTPLQRSLPTGPDPELAGVVPALVQQTAPETRTLLTCCCWRFSKRQTP
uniref:Uncharacterized protein n=1 Tax=Tetraodon nigroviridis TaxID=99883 RepID=H3BVS3_TETNG